MVWRGMAWYGMVRGRHAPMLLRGATNLDSAIVAAASSHIERLNLDFCSYEIFCSRSSPFLPQKLQLCYPGKL